MVVFGRSGCVRAKMDVIGQAGNIRANCCIREKDVVFGKKWLYSGEVVVFGQKWLYSVKVDVFEQNGFV